MLLLSFLVVPVITGYIESVQESIEEHKNILEEDLNETQAKKNTAQKEISTLQQNISITTDKFEKGEITETEYAELIALLNSSLENKTGELQDIAEQENKTVQELLTALEEKENIEQGQEREEKVKSPVIVHLAGFFTAFAYIIVFRRDILLGLPDRMPLIRKPQQKKPKLKNKKGTRSKK